MSSCNEWSGFTESGLTFCFEPQISVQTLHPKVGPVTGSTLLTVGRANFPLSDMLCCQFTDATDSMLLERVAATWLTANVVQCLTLLWVQYPRMSVFRLQATWSIIPPKMSIFTITKLQQSMNYHRQGGARPDRRLLRSQALIFLWLLPMCQALLIVSLAALTEAVVINSDTIICTSPSAVSALGLSSTMAQSVVYPVDVPVAVSFNGMQFRSPQATPTMLWCQ